MMDKQILTSKSVDMATNRYAIAVLKDGKLLNNHSNSYKVMVYVTGPGKTDIISVIKISILNIPANTTQQLMITA